MSTFFTADEHHGHHNVLRLCSRPFAGAQEMTEAFVAKHNAKVGPSDVTYHLGDFAFREQMIPDLLRRMNGTHHLVAGNHDKCHPCHRKHEKAVERQLKAGFASVVTKLHLSVAGVNALLCHLPYRHADDPDQRYFDFRPLDRGQVLIHGHVHTTWRAIGRQINVGVDQWGYAPVHEDELAPFVAEARRAA